MSAEDRSRILNWVHNLIEEHAADINLDEGESEIFVSTEIEGKIHDFVVRVEVL